MTQATTDDDNSDEDEDKIDNEEEGGEWITEENLHKHLTHGLMLPIVPVEAEDRKEDLLRGADGATVKT